MQMVLKTCVRVTLGEEVILVVVKDGRVWEVVAGRAEVAVVRSRAICRRRAMRARVKKRAFRRERREERSWLRFRRELGVVGEGRPLWEGRQSPSMNPIAEIAYE